MKRSFTYYRNATFLSLLLSYGAFYLCRQNFSLAYLPMQNALGISKLTFGTIASLGTLTYAIGKVTTGFVADTRGGRFAFLLALFGSALFSIFFSLGSSIAWFIVTWCLLRAVQSMGWGSLIQIIAHWYPKKKYGTVMGMMSVNYQFGGVLATLMVSFLIAHEVGWRAIFWVPGLALLLIGIVVFFTIKDKPEDVGYRLKREDPDVEQALELISNPELEEEPQDEPDAPYFTRLSHLVRNKNFMLVCALSFVLTFLRECFTLWIPVFFTELGSSITLAAFQSIIFPFLGCIGTLFAGWFSDRFLNARRMPVLAAMLFLLLVSLLFLSELQTFANSIGASENLTAFILIGLIGFFLLGSYSVVGGVLALDFGGKKSGATASGLLDGVGYLGATLAGVGLAKLIDLTSWSYVYTVMSFLAFICFLICFFSFILERENQILNAQLNFILKRFRRGKK